MLLKFHNLSSDAVCTALRVMILGYEELRDLAGYPLHGYANLPIMFVANGSDEFFTAACFRQYSGLEILASESCLRYTWK